MSSDIENYDAGIEDDDGDDQAPGANGNGAAMGLAGANLASNAARIEAIRAAAEVQAQVLAAQAMPRRMNRAIRGMRQSCAQPEFAESAFYRYPRGYKDDGSRNYVSGETVKLARELLRLFGNAQSGIAELARDVSKRPNGQPGMSEMNAWAWDVENNVRQSTTFLVPHARDARGEIVPLIDLRDVYENNANMGARRLRQMILAILPPWYVKMAVDLCRATIAGIGATDGDGQPVPLDVRLTKAAEGFEPWGIRVAHLEAKLGAPFDQWVENDLATLRTIWRSIHRNETTIEDEFPGARAAATAVVLDAQAAATAPPDAPAAGTQDGGPAAPERPPLMRNTRVALDDLFGQAGLSGREHTQRRMRIAGVLAGDEAKTPPVVVRAWKDLDNDQAKAAQAGVRALLALPEDERAARITELDERGRQAAQVPEDGGRDAEPTALDRLRKRFTDAGRGDPEVHGDLMLAVTSVLVHGHWEDLASLEALSQQQVEYALGRLDAVFADAARRDENVGERMDVLYQSVQQQRAAADAAGDQDDTGDTTGE